MRAHPTDAKAKHKQFGSTTSGHGKQALPQTPALKPYFHDDPQEKVAFHRTIMPPSRAPQELPHAATFARRFALRAVEFPPVLKRHRVLLYSCRLSVRTYTNERSKDGALR